MLNIIARVNILTVPETTVAFIGTVIFKHINKERKTAWDKGLQVT